MKRLSWALKELHEAENDLAGELLAVSDRHQVDHELFYLGRDLARWSQRHVRELAATARDYDLDLDPEPKDDASVLATMRQKGAELLGRHHDPAILVLVDLRRIHRMAAGVSLDWEIIAQTAQAKQDRELLGLTKTCHPETLRQLRWANAALKENAPQIMAA
ncbi:hypothetical protein [Glycomyces tarimensis]